MNNNNIEVVENFVYFGSHLCNEGGSDADMKRHIAQTAGVAFHRLWEVVFKRHEISIAIKLKTAQCGGGYANLAIRELNLEYLTTAMQNTLNACEN